MIYKYIKCYIYINISIKEWNVILEMNIFLLTVRKNKKINLDILVF